MAENGSQKELPRLMLVGASGQLGYDVSRVFAPFYEVVGFSSRELDLARPETVAGTVLDLRPEVIINAAAHTRVDDCENEVEKAFLINAEGPARLAAAAAECGSRLVQISTDNLNWITIGALTGTTLSWNRYAFYIPQKSRTLRIRFKMVTDETIHYDGVYIDDIGVNCGEYAGESYKTLSGTSMAAPVVTGALALLAAKYPDESRDSLVARLLSGVTKDERFSWITSSGGMLNLQGALSSEPAPLVTGVSPDYASVGENLTVKGINFGEDPGTVWFETSDGTRRLRGELISWSPGEVVVKAPEKSASYLRIESSKGATSPRFLVPLKNLPLPSPQRPRVYSLCLEGLPEEPRIGNDPATTVPLSLGKDSYTTMHLLVEVPRFEEAVDIYVAIEGLSWSTGDALFFITADQGGAWHTYNSSSPVLFKYAENTTGPVVVKDLIAPGFPADQIPLDWELYFLVAVVPAGNQDWSRYYLWWVDWY